MQAKTPPEMRTVTPSSQVNVSSILDSFGLEGVLELFIHDANNGMGALLFALDCAKANSYPLPIQDTKVRSLIKRMRLLEKYSTGTSCPPEIRSRDVQHEPLEKIVEINRRLRQNFDEYRKSQYRAFAEEFIEFLDDLNALDLDKIGDDKVQTYLSRGREHLNNLAERYFGAESYIAINELGLFLSKQSGRYLEATIEVDFDREDIYVPARLIPVIKNIMDNSSKYGRNRDGRLIMYFGLNYDDKSPDYAKLVVNDCGLGLDYETIGNMAVEKGNITREELGCLPDQKKTRLIFMPGVSEGNGELGMGKGLGLYGVHNIVEGFGGEIEAFNRDGEESGLVFMMKVPVKKVNQ